jgi:hypothetical protein
MLTCAGQVAARVLLGRAHVDQAARRPPPACAPRALDLAAAPEHQEGRHRQHDRDSRQRQRDAHPVTERRGVSRAECYSIRGGAQTQAGRARDGLRWVRSSPQFAIVRFIDWQCSLRFVAMIRNAKKTVHKMSSARKILILESAQNILTKFRLPMAAANDFSSRSRKTNEEAP